MAIKDMLMVWLMHAPWSAPQCQSSPTGPRLREGGFGCSVAKRVQVARHHPDGGVAKSFQFGGIWCLMESGQQRAVDGGMQGFHPAVKNLRMRREVRDRANLKPAYEVRAVPPVEINSKPSAAKPLANSTMPVYPIR